MARDHGFLDLRSGRACLDARHLSRRPREENSGGTSGTADRNRFVAVSATRRYHINSERNFLTPPPRGTSAVVRPTCTSAPFSSGCRLPCCASSERRVTAVNQAGLGLLGADSLAQVLGTSFLAYLELDSLVAPCRRLLEDAGEGLSGSLEIDLRGIPLAVRRTRSKSTRSRTPGCRRHAVGDGHAARCHPRAAARASARRRRGQADRC